MASVAKTSVGDLAASELKGRKLFVRVHLNVALDDNQKITNDARIRAAGPTIKHLTSNGAKVILSSQLLVLGAHQLRRSKTMDELSQPSVPLTRMSVSAQH